MASKIAELDKELRFKWWWPYDPMPDIFIERLRPEELFAVEKLRLQTEIKVMEAQLDMRKQMIEIIEGKIR
jgi:hypothetical protein